MRRAGFALAVAATAWGQGAPELPRRRLDEQANATQAAFSNITAPTVCQGGFVVVLRPQETDGFAPGDIIDVQWRPAPDCSTGFVRLHLCGYQPGNGAWDCNDDPEVSDLASVYRDTGFASFTLLKVPPMGSGSIYKVEVSVDVRREVKADSSTFFIKEPARCPAGARASVKVRDSMAEVRLAAGLEHGASAEVSCPSGSVGTATAHCRLGKLIVAAANCHQGCGSGRRLAPVQPDDRGCGDLEEGDTAKLPCPEGFIGAGIQVTCHGGSLSKIPSCVRSGFLGRGALLT